MTSSLLEPAIRPGVAAGELGALRAYTDRTEQLADQCYTRMHGDLVQMAGVGTVLETWWSAIDDLHTALRATSGHDLTDPAQLFLNEAVTQWFGVRHRALLTLARHVGAPMPEPDPAVRQGRVLLARGGAVGSYGFTPAKEAG